MGTKKREKGKESGQRRHSLNKPHAHRHSSLKIKSGHGGLGRLDGIGNSAVRRWGPDRGSVVSVWATCSGDGRGGSVCSG